VHYLAEHKIGYLGKLVTSGNQKNTYIHILYMNMQIGPRLNSVTPAQNSFIHS